MNNLISEYRKNGLFKVNSLLNLNVVNEIGSIVDELMLGKRSIPGMFFQLDPESKEYKDVNFTNTNYQGPSLRYRKIKDLEYIPEILNAIQNSKLRDIAEQIIGPEVSSMRIMMVNKPEGSHTPLPWHQDVSKSWPMSGRPEFTAWIALDDVDEENGCVEWIARSHTMGAIDDGHIASDQAIDSFLSKGFEVVKGILNKGDAYIFDCAVMHRSAPNLSGRRRRGLTICLMNSKVVNTTTQSTYPKIFGTGCLTPAKVSSLSEVPRNKPKDYGE